MLSNITRRVIVSGQVQQRFSSVVAGPPTNHVPKGEKMVLASIMLGSLFVIPAWVLLNLRDYKSPK